MCKQGKWIMKQFMQMTFLRRIVRCQNTSVSFLVSWFTQSSKLISNFMFYRSTETVLNLVKGSFSRWREILFNYYLSHIRWKRNVPKREKSWRTWKILFISLQKAEIDRGLLLPSEKCYEVPSLFTSFCSISIEEETNFFFVFFLPNVRQFSQGLLKC